MVSIKVIDNGKGIHPEILGKLGQRGETHGKTDGHGLGLYHAKTTIESWGGMFNIESDLGVGTQITIMLKKEVVPNWFLPELNVEDNVSIVILDDDSSIHQVWKGRFESTFSSANLVHFSNGLDFSLWRKNNPNKKAIFLFDYELLGQAKTGLDWIEELNIASEAILITSRFEEARVVERCTKLGVKLIPKPLVSLVPIVKIKTEQTLTCTCEILIDDDPLIRMVWDSRAKAKGVNFKAYPNVSSFLKDISTYNYASVIYIDSSLGDGVKGEEVAFELYQKGFREIHLATGYEPDQFKDLYYLKSIIGKAPPWDRY